MIKPNIWKNEFMFQTTNQWCFCKPTYLVGGFKYLEKYRFVNGKDDIPYMKWKIKNVPNHQPVMSVQS